MNFFIKDNKNNELILLFFFTPFNHHIYNFLYFDGFSIAEFFLTFIPSFVDRIWQLFALSNFATKSLIVFVDFIGHSVLR